mmetsp:Transcript_85995/g.256517  ORF Transcript_85995/g.256517 Transcript_85995/m.256517 type:complete len:217 (-) Transcript_85995:410-1060(-)
MAPSEGSPARGCRRGAGIRRAAGASAGEPQLQPLSREAAVSGAATGNAGHPQLFGASHRRRGSRRFARRSIRCPQRQLGGRQPWAWWAAATAAAGTARGRQHVRNAQPFWGNAEPDVKHVQQHRRAVDAGGQHPGKQHAGTSGHANAKPRPERPAATGRLGRTAHALPFVAWWPGRAGRPGHAGRAGQLRRSGRAERHHRHRHQPERAHRPGYLGS